VVHARSVKDQTLTLIVSGKLWRNSMIMLDEETKTLWSHITGRAMEGPLLGRQLASIPMVQTTWKAWSASHPETRVLKKSREVRSSRYQSYFDDEEKAGMFRAVWLQEKMPGKTVIHGVTSGPHALAVTEARLPAGAVVNGMVGEEAIVLVRSVDGGVRAWTRQVGGTLLQFTREAEAGPVTDRGTDSVWDLEQGVCIGGTHLGARLEEKPVLLAYWFAWSGFYPNTTVVD
jgi:hypothetical protein